LDYKLELVVLPVTDVDRAKAFYEQVGFTADHDHAVSDEIRFVQLTPPGSACSIAIGTGLTEAGVGGAGSSAGMQVVVSDAEAARADLLSRGIEVGEVQKSDWGEFLFFSDPDGNRWSVQGLPDRG
jgi:catechol 2,3-dioxygenase-like lactoylglutathione lyase family enzyme